MKGIAHFISGVTVASFCPWAVEAAQNGNPAFFILGAFAGILPDTVDFKFYRFFYSHDIRIEPDADELDPQPIADAVAAAVSAAAEGRKTTLKLSTIKMGADNWRQYRVKIDPEAGEVRVQFGPVVSTGQVPQPDTLPANRSIGLAKFSAPILQSYEPTYTVDIFDGPSFKFTKREARRKPAGFLRRLLDIRYWLLGQSGRRPRCSAVDTNNQSLITNNCLFKNEGFEKSAVEIDFLPWHRNWSHSLTVGAFLAGIASFWTWQAGVVIFGAYVIHVIEDQMGHMGSNLFFPFTKKRAPGFKMMHSGDAFPNFAGVWICCLLIFWNVYKAIPDPLYHFSFLRFIMTAMVIPFAIFGAIRWLLTRADKGHPETLSTEWNV
jgi:membrane-bound metal-dependent hydrolase YbcI (DUF457 family)